MTDGAAMPMQRKKSSRVVSWLGLLGVWLTCGVCLWGCGLFNPCGNGVLDKGEACEGTVEQACQTTCNTRGRQVCNPKTCQWQACVSIEKEVCNGVDDDCDGQTDEDFECALGSTKPCVTSCGTQGTIACNETCEWETTCTPPREICGNGIDDDCNGLTDQFGIIGEKKKIADGFADFSEYSVVWTGTEYGLAWNNKVLPYSDIYFMRLSEDGHVLRGPEKISPEERKRNWTPSLAWNGASYGLAWVKDHGVRSEIHFYDIHPDKPPSGHLVLDPFQGDAHRSLSAGVSLTWADTGYLLGASFSDDKVLHKWGAQFCTLHMPDQFNCGAASIFPSSGTQTVWMGNIIGYTGWAWNKEKGVDEIRFSLLKGFPDKLVLLPWQAIFENGFSAALGVNEHGFLAVGVVIEKYSNLYSRLIAPDGRLLGDPLAITDHTGISGAPSVAWSGREFGLAWQDGRDGGARRFQQKSDYGEEVPLAFREIYFARLSHKGEKLEREIRITKTQGRAAIPAILHTRERYGLFWLDFSEDYHFESDGQLKGALYFVQLGCQ